MILVVLLCVHCLWKSLTTAVWPDSVDIPSAKFSLHYLVGGNSYAPLTLGMHFCTDGIAAGCTYKVFAALFAQPCRIVVSEQCERNQDDGKITSR